MEGEKQRVECSNCGSSYKVAEERLHSQFFCRNCSKHAVLIGQAESLHEVYPAKSIPDDWKRFGVTGWIAGHSTSIIIMIIVFTVIMFGEYRCQCPFYSYSGSNITDYEKGDYHVELIYKEPEWVSKPSVFFNGKRVLSGQSYYFGNVPFKAADFGLKGVEEGKHKFRIKMRESGKVWQKEVSLRRHQPYIFIIIDQERHKMEIKMKHKDIEGSDDLERLLDEVNQ